MTDQPSLLPLPLDENSKRMARGTFKVFATGFVAACETTELGSGMYDEGHTMEQRKIACLTEFRRIYPSFAEWTDISSAYDEKFPR